METIKEEQVAVDEFNLSAVIEAELNGPSANRPAIDHLPDAVVRNEAGELVLLARPGEKLVIERFATVLTHRPWLDTRTYTIVAIDSATGRVDLWDEDLHRCSSTNYVTALGLGYRMKLATKATEIGKRKRGRPRKNPPVEAKPVQLGPDGKPEKKKRGRPAGVKNRPKDVIAAEKAAIRKARAEKIAKRNSKKAVRVVRSAAPVEPVVQPKTKAKPKATTRVKPKAKPAAKKPVAKKAPARKAATKKPVQKGAKAKPGARVPAKRKAAR